MFKMDFFSFPKDIFGEIFGYLTLKERFGILALVQSQLRSLTLSLPLRTLTLSHIPTINKYYYKLGFLSVKDRAQPSSEIFSIMTEKARGLFGTSSFFSAAPLWTVEVLNYDLQTFGVCLIELSICLSYFPNLKS